MPWQESLDLKNLLELQQVFESNPLDLHHLYTTYFVTITEP